ncbi:Zinc-finger homeodomain protein [Thalictrum thalictroides]|uniref:Zinc-finger homeodomain protein n=1 Tax=Thalictrum thalictroides TaxID=46969 RepID=A0A7J6V7K8_THATH|nr:Zinc-finger homeodomain protein [Thalictrum thalictroides]
MKFEHQEEQQGKTGSSVQTRMAMASGVRNSGLKAATCRYKDCMKNHAAIVGGHAVDGCGEFMPAGPDGTVESLKCAACNCHRNFHRKEIIEGADTFIPPSTNHQQQHYYPAPSATMDNHVAQNYGEEQEDMSNPSRSGKRFRTKFTEEQKEKMKEFAEKLGWKIQRHDEAEAEQFCKDMCIKRQVLKVWIHNHKYTLGKKD